MQKNFKLIIPTVALALAAATSGCSTGVLGEQVVGSPGSLMWFSTASTATQINYFKGNCLGYGFTPGTPQMAQCLQTEITSSKSRATSRLKVK